MVTESRTYAVWTGRFQPPHEGHFAILRHSLRTIDLPHVAVLTCHFGELSDSPYGLAAAPVYASWRNPLTVWERYRLMSLGLAGHGLSENVSLLTAPRHDLDWERASTFYPPRRLICLTAKDGFEDAKRKLWEERGEDVRVLHEFNCARTLTTTRIRRLVNEGADWRSYIPEACHSYFEEIGAPERIFGVVRP